MESSTVIWIVVLVVAVVVVAVVASVLARKRRDDRRRAEAHEIRQDADAHAGSVGNAHADAAEKEQRAELARLEAERAEREAAQARVGATQEQALHEDRVREADRVDPDVDHRSDEYAPGTPGSQDPLDARPGEGTRAEERRQV